MRKRLIFVALALAGCNSDFTMPYEVDEPKLMGVRLEVQNDPTRASPRVGENFTLRWLLARPGAPSALPLDQQITGGVSVCAGTVLPTGDLFCAQEIDLDGLGLKEPNIVRNMDEIEMPLNLAIDPRSIALSTRVLLFGAVCVDGQVERVAGKSFGKDPTTELYRCTQNDDAVLKRPLIFTSSVFADYQDDQFPANLNPGFSCDDDTPTGICQTGTDHDGEQKSGGAIVMVFPNERGEPKDKTKRAQEWLPSTVSPESLPFEGCANDETFAGFKIRAGSDDHIIRMRFDASDRETYQVEEEELNKLVVKTKREELLIAGSATKYGGKLERYFSVLARDTSDDEAEIELKFKPPNPKKSAKPEEAIPEDGKLVRFYFVVRDQRGGVDYTTRELCVLPKLETP